MKYLLRPLKITKDHLFEPPPIFRLIQENSGADNREMYQVFNMGHRLEIFTNADTAAALINMAQEFTIEAKLVGKVEAAERSRLVLKGTFGELVYEY